MIYPHWVYRLEGFPENPEKWLVRTPEEDENMGPGFTDPYGVRCPLVIDLTRDKNILQEEAIALMEPAETNLVKRGGWPKGKPRKVRE